MNKEGVRSSGAEPVPSAESLTMSTESETFESWTVVTEGAKKNMKAALEVPVDQEEEDEEEEEEEEAEETAKQLDEEKENRGTEIIEKEESNKRDNESTDDLSDGISIISDSESAGRISPHPFNRKIPETGTNESEESAKEDAPYDPLTPPTTPLKEAETCTKVTSFVERSPERLSSTGDPKSQEQPRRFFGLGVRGIFVVSVLVAVLAFVGRLNFPWETEPEATGVSSMMDKLEEMEIQNNFLRAEIDILTKQINFLKTKQQSEVWPRGEQNVPYNKQEGKQYEKYEKKKEKPKWPGSGDMYIKPLEPYRKPSLPPPSSYDVEKQSKPTENIPPISSGQQPHYESKGDYYERRPGKEEYQKYPDSPKYPPKDGKYNPKRDPKYDPRSDHKYDPKYDQKYDPKSDRKYDPKYDPKYQKHENGKPYKSEDHKMAKGDHYSKEKYYKDDHEIYRKADGRKDHYSGDGYHEKHDYKRKEDDWHEKMMQQREEMRRKQDRHNSNNWYIERGNGREEARVDSREYRREER